MSYDAVVVGSGPNGLAAAITLAEAGRSVLVREAEAVPGGGARTLELTLPGFRHDVCSAVHPLAVASPFLRSLPLERHELRWIRPSAPLAHPLDDGRAALLESSVEETARGLGDDGAAYLRLMGPFVDDVDGVLEEVLRMPRVPRAPVRMARFGIRAVRSARRLARRFDGEPARALIAGLAAHAMLPLERATTAAYALVLALAAHGRGWPIPAGGSQRITDALLGHLRGLGGELQTEAPVRALNELPPSRLVMLDLTPRQVLRIAGDRLPGGYRDRLRGYRYGPGVYKVDWSLDGEIPWRDPSCARAGTVHLGGTMREIAGAERAAWRGELVERPFVLLAQPSRFDDERAPEGRHTAWAYCHVPWGTDADYTDRIEAQVERFAPGFRDRVLARSAMGPAALEGHNANLVGGDISGGSMTPRQLFFRPTASLSPYRTPVDGVYICSASTPPGGGVHGMCGHRAARAALADGF